MGYQITLKLQRVYYHFNLFTQNSVATIIFDLHYFRLILSHLYQLMLFFAWEGWELSILCTKLSFQDTKWVQYVTHLIIQMFSEDFLFFFVFVF